MEKVSKVNKMTAEQFLKYCKRNKPTSITPTEYGIEFRFKTRVIIDCSTDIDGGFHYAKRTKAKRNAGKQIFKDLNLLMPNMLQNMIDKYAPKSFDKFLSETT